MLKVGVVGLGSMGQHHARLYSQFGCLVGVADINSDKAREIGHTYGVPYYHDYLNLMREVDAVSVVVSTTLHYAVAMEFLRHGVHCLVEKPIAFSVDEAMAMIEASKTSGVNLAVGHIEQFNPAVIQLRQLIREGALGDVMTIATRRVGPFVPRVRDVGVIMDSATHDIGVANYLLGKRPKRVYSWAGNYRHEKADHAIVVMDYDSTTVCIEVNWFTPKKVRTLIATGSQGTAYLDYIDQTLMFETSQRSSAVDVAKNEPLKLELEDFLESVRTHQRPVVNGEDGMEILKIALEAQNAGR